MTPLPSPLLAVTDRHQAARALPDQVAALVEAGIRWVWFRDRDLPMAERRALAEAVRAVTASAGARLSIGGDVGLAAATGADGVHLPLGSDIAVARRHLGPAALVGVSAHSLTEAEAAARAGADYATLSPIYASASKPGYGPALGPEALTAAAAALPVMALGGVTPGRAAACRRAGASGAAVMGELMRAADPAPLVRALLAEMADPLRPRELP